MDTSDDGSCSDCKIEIIKQRWTQLLLNWFNKCIHPTKEVNALNPQSLVEVINRYKNDICYNDMDRAMLCTDDLEPFLRYKYPILRLRYFCDETDVPRKMYIMTSVLLFHCCVSSQMGIVVGDICMNLDNDEQEMVLRFCEKLSEMETTLNNVDSAVRDACESVNKFTKKSNLKLFKPKNPGIITESYIIPSDFTITDTTSDLIHPKKVPTLKFKSSVTVMPSCVTDTSSSYSKTVIHPVSASSSDIMVCNAKLDAEAVSSNEIAILYNVGSLPLIEEREEKVESGGTSKMREDIEIRPPCKPDCACTRCGVAGPCCGLPNSSVDCYGLKSEKDDPYDYSGLRFLSPSGRRRRSLGGPRVLSKKSYSLGVGMIILSIFIIVLSVFTFLKNKEHPTDDTIKGAGRLLEAKNFVQNSIIKDRSQRLGEEAGSLRSNSQIWAWGCRNNVCQKIYLIYKNVNSNESIYTSLTRCTLLCMGPQIWPLPIGYTFFSKTIVALATNKLEYKFQSIPSDIVHQYLAEAFKLFIGDLARLERIDLKDTNKTQDTEDMKVNKMNIQIDVETDPDPRLRLNTDESYSLKIETTNVVRIHLTGASFCGIRHALETLSQMILLDQSTGNLITVSNAAVNDAPSYKYRGLMIDTGRNYIPVSDLLRVIDGMATCKLNTFHWRISDSTSFPLFLPKLSKLFEFGAYGRTMVYTKEDIKTIVARAGIRGIRVLIEVAIPGPVGRAWSWSTDASCPKKNDKKTCENILCSRLKMRDSVFDVLQHIYAEIIGMTGVEDIFHLSDSLFSLSNCYYLIDEREGFLEKAIERLRLANKGFLPKMPLIWYTPHLEKDYEAKSWETYGVQIHEWKPHRSGQVLGKFRVIHSSKWDLSCEIKKLRCTKYRTWQEMYSWKMWQTIEVFTNEGGEAILWTDLVDSGNLEYHLWPRAVAVAERLWSDLVANSTPNGRDYVRLDSHRWRMQLRGVKVQPIWPLWCSFNPAPCLDKLKRKQLIYSGK